MPRAFDNCLTELSFSERAARVRTGVIDGVKRSLHVEDRNPDPIDFNRSSCARRNLIGKGDSDEIIHHMDVPLGSLCAASEERLLDFNAPLWHRNSNK